MSDFQHITLLSFQYKGHRLDSRIVGNIGCAGKQCKKMYLAEKELLRLKEVNEWTYPVLHQGRQWYVDFFAYDPSRGVMRRKKFMLDRYPTRKAKRTMASELIHNLVQKLKAGWNPFVSGGRTRQFTPWGRVMERYKEYLETAVAKRQLKAKTAYDYRSRLKQMELYQEETGNRIGQVSEFSQPWAVDYLDYLIYDKDVTSRTRNNHRTWLSTLGAWLVEKRYLTQNPIEDIRMLREEEKKRDPLSSRQLQQLKAYLMRENRHFLLCCLMVYYANIRPEELRNIRLGDISIREQTVTVRAEISKNRKTQSVGLHDEIVRMMIELKTFEGTANQDYLFGDDLRPGRQQAYINRFRLEWKKVREALRWDDRFQFYSLKDSGIRDGINAMGLVRARDQARHSDVAVTNLYAKRSVDPHEESKHWEGEL